jgi:hypothetical protein
MTTRRADLEGQLAAIEMDAERVLAGLSADQVNWRPAPDCWSIGECISHLNVGIRAVLPPLDRAIESARERGLVGPGSGRYGWFANWMVRSQEPPVKRRVKTFPVFQPVAARHDAAALVSEFHAVRGELRLRLARAEGIDWARARVVSPASRFFRLPFGAYVAFLLAHDRRHLWQAREVRNHPAFPA